MRASRSESRVSVVAVVGYLTLTRWLAPTTPMILAGSAIAILLLCLNGLVAFYHHSGRSAESSLRTPLIWTLVSAGVGAAMVSAWMSSQMRDRVLQQLPDSKAASAQVTSTTAAQGDLWRRIELAALDDPDRAVGARACRRIVEIGPGLQRGQLLEHLERHPKLARACIESSQESDAAKVVSRAVELSRVLQTRWIESATTRASNRPREACRHIDPVLTLPDRESTGTPALLRCVVGDEPDAFQKCCASQLIDHVGKGRSLGAELGSSIDETIAREIASPLLRASVYQTQLDESDKARFDKLKLQHPDIQRFALRLSCNFIVSKGGPEGLVRQLSAWLERDQCLGRAGALEGDYTEWADLCDRAIAPLAEADYPGQRLCSMAEGHLVELTVDRARERVQAAIGGGFRSMWEEGIKSGVSMQRQAKRSPEAFKGALSDIWQNNGANREGYRAFLESMQGVDSKGAMENLNQKWLERAQKARKKNGQSGLETMFDRMESGKGLDRMKESGDVADDDVEKIRKSIEKARDKDLDEARRGLEGVMGDN